MPGAEAAGQLYLVRGDPDSGDRVRDLPGVLQDHYAPDPAVRGHDDRTDQQRRRRFCGKHRAPGLCGVHGAGNPGYSGTFGPLHLLPAPGRQGNDSQAPDRDVGDGEIHRWLLLVRCGGEFLLHQHQRAQRHRSRPGIFRGKLVRHHHRGSQEGRAHRRPPGRQVFGLLVPAADQLRARGQQHRNGEIPGISGDRHRRPGAGRDRGQPGGEPGRLHHNPGRPEQCDVHHLAGGNRPSGTGDLHGARLPQDRVDGAHGDSLEPVCQGDREHYAAHRGGGGLVLPGVHLAVPEDFTEHRRADPGFADRHGPGGGGRHGGGGAGGPGRRNRAAGRKLQPHGFQYQGPDREGLPDPAGQEGSGVQRASEPD